MLTNVAFIWSKYSETFLVTWVLPFSWENRNDLCVWPAEKHVCEHAKELGSIW